MPLINAFFRQTVSLRRYLGIKNGEPVYGQPEMLNCRFEKGHILRTSSKFSSGIVDEVPAGARMYCVCEPIPMRSEVVYGGKDYRVINCKVLNGFADDHLEVLLS